MAAASKKNGSVTHHALSKRLLELTAETRLPEPYQVTDDIVVAPPTRGRREAMNTAEMNIFACQQLLAETLKAATVPAPIEPTYPSPPEEPTVDDPAAARTPGEDEQCDRLRDEYARLLGEHNTVVAGLRAEYDAALKRWSERVDVIKASAASINAQLAQANDEWERAFFGDAYDAVTAFFDDKPTWWAVFVPDIRAEFLPAAPDNGVKDGVVVDEDAAGKVRASST